jgi:hypothetical protein
MAIISQSDFDNSVAHTIRIELKNGSTLLYRVSVEAKTALYKILNMEVVSDVETAFIWFYIPHDRLVFVNKKDIIRITFCFDALDVPEPEYYDNFGMLDNSAEADSDTEDDDEDNSNELYLPQLIITHNRKFENTKIVEGVTIQTEGYFGNISSYSSLNEGDVEGFDFESFVDEDEWQLLTYTYLQFIDDDGEENFMPLDNLSVIEIERLLIMSDETLDLYLNRKTQKKNRTKKK